jgi:hypothetical protein
MIVILRFFQAASEPINELENKQKITMTTVIKQDKLEISPFEDIGLLFEGSNDTFQVIATSRDEFNVLIYDGSSEEQANWIYESLVKGGNK